MLFFQYFWNYIITCDMSLFKHVALSHHQRHQKSMEPGLINVGCGSVTCFVLGEGWVQCLAR